MRSAESMWPYSEIRGELAESTRPGILERVAIEAGDGEPVDVFVRVVEAIDHFHAGDPDKRQRPAEPPGTGDQRQEPEPLVGPEHVGLRGLRLNDRAPHPHEVGDSLRMRRQLEVREHQHAAQAMPDPVDAVASGLALERSRGRPARRI